MRPFQLGAVTARSCGRDHIPRALGEAGNERFVLGAVFTEMIQIGIKPLDEQSVYARVVAEKDEGVQHVAVDTPNVDDVVVARAI